jgi:hypothetical protein
VGSVPLASEKHGFDTLRTATRRLHPAFDIVAGVKNALDRAYWDPAGDRHIIDAYPRRGRTAFVKLAWQYGE